VVVKRHSSSKKKYEDRQIFDILQQMFVETQCTVILMSSTVVLVSVMHLQGKAPNLSPLGRAITRLRSKATKLVAMATSLEGSKHQFQTDHLQPWFFYQP